ncbi:hypothetical protein N7444_000277 [Penicillium canescens]|nr:hypothetical protein N7444_000277 [Penicillium canescens]
MWVPRADHISIHQTSEKEPVVDSVGEKDVQVGITTHLDEGKVFLRQHGFTMKTFKAYWTMKHATSRGPQSRSYSTPLLAGTYMLQNIDKSALAYSAVFDLLKSTHMSSNEYSWLASIFYFAYLVAEYPWTVLAQKTNLAKVVSCNIVAWGAMLMITAACSAFTGMAICRFLLGVFEAPITPCFMMIIGMWYTRSQQPFRAGVFYSCNGVGAMVGGVLTFGIGQIETIAVWRAIYLILGGITVCWGIVMLFFLPGDVLSAKRFSLEDKALLIGRGRLGRTDIINHQSSGTRSVVNGGIANFSKLIIKGLTHDSLTTVAQGIPFGAFQVVWVLSGTYFASRFANYRTIVMFAYLIPTIVGIALMWKLDHATHKVGVLFSYYIVGAYVCSLVLALQMPATNLAPHAFLAKEAPIYQTGCKVLLACSSAQAALTVCLRWLLILRNKHRDAAAAAANESGAPFEVDESADLTDFENPNFRYVL